MNFQHLSSFRVAVGRDPNISRRDRVRAGLLSVVHGLDLLAIVAGEKRSPLARRIRAEATHYAAELARLALPGRS